MNIDTPKPFKVWCNFRTETYDYLDQSPTDYRDYIPQHAEAQGLYSLLIAEGKNPALAALEVLARGIGETP